jgi:hypothetical protein
MIFACNMSWKQENPLCIMFQRSAGFFYLVTVKLGILHPVFISVKAARDITNNRESAIFLLLRKGGPQSPLNEIRQKLRPQWQLDN